MSALTRRDALVIATLSAIAGIVAYHTYHNPTARMAFGVVLTALLGAILLHIAGIAGREVRR